MGKVVVVLVFVVSSHMWAGMLEKNCLSCHQKQQIPSHLIYKRYLLKYSTKRGIEEVMLHYLQNPNKKDSIMPPEFFLKFPMKKATTLDESALQKSVEAFVDYYDVKKRLVLEKSP